MNKTFIPNFDFNKKKWYIIDCKDQQLGRLSSSIVSLLLGKTNPHYFPSLDMGNYVILINIEFLLYNKKLERFHVFCPGRPGKSLKKIRKQLPQRIIRNCIFRMLPNSVAKRNLPNRLKIYQSSHHPYRAQNPIYLNKIKNLNKIL